MVGWVGKTSRNKTSGPEGGHDLVDGDGGGSGDPDDFNGDGVLDGVVGGHEANFKMGEPGGLIGSREIDDDGFGDDFDGGGSGFCTCEIVAVPLEMPDQISSRRPDSGWGAE